MIQLFPHRFIIIAITNIGGLLFCCSVLKKYLPKFQDHLIPLFTLTVSTLTSVIWGSFGAAQPHILFYLFLGLIEGLATTGLHQTYKQLRRHIIYTKELKKLNADKTSRRRIS